MDIIIFMKVRDRLKNEGKPADNTVFKYYEEPANAEKKFSLEPNPLEVCASGVERNPEEEKALFKGKTFVYQQKYYWSWEEWTIECKLIYNFFIA